MNNAGFAIFTVLGEPVAKGRPKFTRQGPYVRTYTPEKTANYESLVRLEYERQCDSISFAEGVPLCMSVVAYFQIPKSASKKKRQEMSEGKTRPTKRPDLDNIIKIIADALNGVAYADDAQVVGCSVQKFFSDKPRVEIALYEITWPEEGSRNG